MTARTVSSANGANKEFSVANAYSYDTSSPVGWVISHVLRYKRYLVTFLAGSILYHVLYNAVYVMTGAAFNAVIQPQPQLGQFIAAVVGVLVVVLLFGPVNLAATSSIIILGRRLERDARDEVYQNLLGKSLLFHNRQQSGDIMARVVNDVQQLNPMLYPGFDMIFDSLMSLIVPLLFIGLLRVELLLSPILFTVAFLVALWFYSNRLGYVSGQLREQFGMMNAQLAEALLGIEVVYSTGQEERMRRTFEAHARQYRDLFVQVGRIQAGYLPPLLFAVAQVGALVHGILLLSRGQLSLGELVAYIGLMAQLRFPIGLPVFAFALMYFGLASAGRILELIRADTEIDQNEAGYSAKMRGSLVFDQVSFGYDNSPAIKNISFRIEPGQTVAVVGQVGSGKTTIARLLNRSYDAQTGRVLIDGVDVREWNLTTLRSQIAMIEQDVFLFSKSIAENIAFGMSGLPVDRAAVEAAAREAQAHEFITNFKDGYDTLIGSRGITLSGGQRQRLAIARALMTQPAILILDDAASAIDSATEDEIQKAIGRLLQGRTTILITHRLAQIRQADAIMMLHQGEIVDYGTHDELLARCESYRRMFGYCDDQLDPAQSEAFAGTLESLPEKWELGEKTPPNLIG